MGMYNLPITTLKAQYRYQLTNMAVTCWKHQNYSNDKISDKITEINKRIDGASKKQFVEMFEEYISRVNLLMRR